MDMSKVKYIIDKVVKEFPGVTYSIKESDSTNSMYVRFYYNERKKTVRISDHSSSKSMPSNNFMDEGKSMGSLERFLINNVKALKKSAFYDLFDKIKQQDGGMER